MIFLRINLPKYFLILKWKSVHFVFVFWGYQRHPLRSLSKGVDWHTWHPCFRVRAVLPRWSFLSSRTKYFSAVTGRHFIKQQATTTVMSFDLDACKTTSFNNVRAVFHISGAPAAVKSAMTSRRQWWWLKMNWAWWVGKDGDRQDGEGWWVGGICDERVGFLWSLGCDDNKVRAWANRLDNIEDIWRGYVQRRLLGVFKNFASVTNLLCLNNVKSFRRQSDVLHYSELNSSKISIEIIKNARVREQRCRVADNWDNNSVFSVQSTSNSNIDRQ